MHRKTIIKDLYFFIFLQSFAYLPISKNEIKLDIFQIY